MSTILKNSKIRLYLHLLILVVATFAVYWQALGHDFLINWDDRQYVLDNPVIRGLTPEHLKAAFTSFYIGNYAPLHLISYMLDYEIWGLRASGFIFTNILLHTMNGLLFYMLLRRVAGEKMWTFPAALIFLLHPVQVESVAWVSQRKNLLAMLFFLIGFHLYVLYRERAGRQGTTLYLLSLAAFVLAILAKSVVVVMPMVLLLYDLTFTGRRDLKGLLLDKIPFAVIAAIFSLVAVESQSWQYLGGKSGWHGGTPYATFLTMLPVLVTYLRQVIWPADLSAFYDVPVKTAIDLDVALAIFINAVLIVLGVLIYRRRRDVFFWYALFFVGLIPVSQIVPIVTLMNDRYLYFPMLGGAAFLCAVIHEGMEKVKIGDIRKGLAVSALMLVVAWLYAAAGFQRVGVWQNSATLWGDAVQKAPGIALTHDCYGEGLLQQGKIDDAIRELRTAISLEPDIMAGNLSRSGRYALANTRNNLGTAYGMRGMTDAAIEQFSLAVRLNPGLAKAYFNLGNALMHKGLVDRALDCFETAVRLEPGNPAFAANLRLTRELKSSTGSHSK